MKVYAISDLHMEFHADAAALFAVLQKDGLPDADIVILAGDIGTPSAVESSEHNVNYRNLLKLFKEKYAHVVLVAGNHEFYNTAFYDRQAVVDTIQKICDETGVVFLHRSSVVIGDIEFVGATLWSLVNSEATMQMNDFRRDIFKSRLDAVETFFDDFKWLRTFLQTNEKKTRVRIVVTHHLPSTRMIHPRFRLSTCNSGFATHIVDEIPMASIDAWVCGHTHEFIECTYGKTYLLANPLGYPEEDRRTQRSLSLLPLPPFSE